MHEERSRRWTRLSALFDELAELPAREREARLAALAGDDAELAHELHALLLADSEADGVLERSLDALAPALATSDDAEWETPAGSAIGRYRLLEPIGRGGMGEVWLAERADGEYQQRVALKLLKRGMDTQAILRRFLQERSILARLNHPRIVRLLDGGMSADGRPWYAMDYVEGRAIGVHAAAHALDVRARVERVAQVADAVAYAHARLIVHRDLKPSNILVGDDGVPHLLDFGIAKLLEDTGEHTLTGTATRVLSPAYAAPEQILGEPVGTATDVYALGAVLFELLTGALPHRRSSRDPGALAAELARESTDKASHALASRADDALRNDYGEGADRHRLARSLSGDLDLILATALKREPERRYATAAAFAEDLRRWLDGRPIAARPDSARYRLGKFVRRHRLGVGAAALIALALVGGLAASLWQAGIARQQAARAELVKEFMLSLFREHDPIARAQAQARSPREIVAAGVERARRELADDPALRRDVLADLGRLQVTLGDARAAAAVLAEVFAESQRSAGEASVAAALVEADYARALADGGEYARAQQHAEHAVGVLEAALGEQALATAQARAHLARVLLTSSQHEAALALARQVHRAFAEQRGADDPDTLAHLISVGMALEQLMRFDEAGAIFAEALEGSERAFGPEHARVARPAAMLADVWRKQQRYAEARPLLERAIAVTRKQLGDRHPLLGGQLMRHGDLLRRLGEYDAAAAAFDAAAACFAPVSGEAAQIAQFRGGLLSAQGRWAEAAEAFRQSHETFLATLGDDSLYAWISAAEHGAALAELGRLDEARVLLETTLARQEAIAGADSYDAAIAAAALGRVRRLQGEAAQARDLHERALARLAELYGADAPNAAGARFELARDLRALGEHARARAELDRVLAHIGPDTSIAELEGEIRLESALLAQAEGDRDRQRLDAARAVELLRDAAAAPPTALAQARSLAAQ